MNYTPLAITFGKFHNYNSDWEITRIIAFEYFVMLSEMFGKDQFYRQQHIISQETRLSSHTLRKHELPFLIERGFLSIEEKAYGRYLYSVNKKKIVLSLNEILEFGKIESAAKRNAYQKSVAISFAKYLRIYDQIDWSHYSKSLCD